ncbi:hypothetical protein ACLQ2N_04455 [Streptomyces sp. DT224]|uniref:hypothetical protein n=1 Tax=Streptomyces sp. DT224 TaxID=3393426 RepID=UPI003CF1C583
MTSNPPLPVRPLRHGAAAHPRFPCRHFEMRLSSTPRSCQLARRLAGERLDS